MTDLTGEAFLVLRSFFFDRQGRSTRFVLRDKRNTQDDPFDELIHSILSERLPGDCSCIKAPGPLITPDIVVLRPEPCRTVSRGSLANDLERILAMEVKKLERTGRGDIARSSGLDYNTTPPCGTVRIYDHADKPVDIRGFYLFVCQETVPGPERTYVVSALAFCDGNLLNEDFDYYLSVVGARKKAIGIGSYGDGADRERPMLIFANPLGVPLLDRAATLIHLRSDLTTGMPNLKRIGVIRRTTKTKEGRKFYCYRVVGDAPSEATEFDVADPFPTPERQEGTQPRGRFRLGISVPD